MTSDSRKAIPGRPPTGDASLDRLMFGDREAAKPKDEAKLKDDPKDKEIRVRLRERAAAANDDEEASEDPVATGEISFVERAAKDRRRNQGRRQGEERRRSQDRRREYSRLPDERGNFGSENSKRGPFLAAIAIAVALVFGALVWNMYRDGVKTDVASLKPKVIPGGSYKSKPDTEEAADADADGAQNAQTAQVPTVEEPPTTSLEGGPTVAASEPAPASSPSHQPSAAPTVASAAPSPAPAAPPSAIPPKPSPAAPAAQAAAPKPVAPKPSPSPKPVAPTVASASSPAFARDGKYVVQLAALSAESEADAEWARRVKLAPELFASAEKLVVKAEVNGKTVYRLRVGAFAQAADADAFCAAFKARGGVCFRAMK